MNTQLLRYNVLNEHPSFPPIPHPVGWFRANGSHQAPAGDGNRGGAGKAAQSPVGDVVNGQG